MVGLGDENGANLGFMTQQASHLIMWGATDE